MFRQLFNLTLKRVCLGKITHTTTYRLPATLVIPQKSLPYIHGQNASTQPKTVITETSSLESIIKELQRRATSKSRLFDDELKSVLFNVKTQRIDSAQSIEILRCCTEALTDENQSDIINEIWTELKTQNVCQVKHYNWYLRFHRDKRDSKRAQNTFDEMIEAGIEPETPAYNFLLSAHCRSGNVEKATETSRIMKKNAVIIMKGPLNDLIQCHISYGNIEAAKETMTDVKMSNNKVDLQSLSALLNYYAKFGDVENITTTFDIFNEENWKLLNSHIFQVMCELAVNGHSEKIASLFAYLDSFQLSTSISRAIPIFVEKRQSPLVPKILQLVDGDRKLPLMLLMLEMIRLNTVETEFNETIANIENLGMTTDLLKALFEEDSNQIVQYREQLQIKGGSWLKELIKQKSELTLDQSTAQERLDLSRHIRDENIVAVDAILSRGHITLEKSDYALLINFYARLNDLEKALKMLQQASANASFKLNIIIGARLATMMIEKGYDFGEVESLLRAHPQNKFASHIFFIERLFVHLAENGHAELANKFFDALMKYGYITPTPQYTKLIILAYIKAECIEEAVEKYEHFAATYKIVTKTTELFTHLIQHERKDLLQRAFVVTKEVKSEYAALGRLASAFINCGMIEPVQKTLKRFNFKYLEGYITLKCKEFATFSELKSAQTFLMATEGVNCNRHPIYQTILDICEKQNNTQVALQLWHDYQAEYQNLIKSDFKAKLVKLLEANDIGIPAELKD